MILRGYGLPPGNPDLGNDLYGDLILESINIIGPLPSKMWQARANSSTFFKDDGSWLEDRKPSENENLRPLAVRLRERMKNEL